MASPAPPAAPAPSASAVAAAGAASPSGPPVPAPVSAPPVPTPSLKPGEAITWIKIERPRLELGQVLVGSFVLVGLTMALALSLGILLGQLRGRGQKTHGTGGLDLR